jgi:hypothetical protein
MIRSKSDPRPEMGASQAIREHAFADGNIRITATDGEYAFLTLFMTPVSLQKA